MQNVRPANHFRKNHGRQAHADANGRETFITGGGKVFRGKIVGPNDEPDGFAWIPHWGHCPKANQIRHAHKAVKAAKERKEPVFVCEQMTFEGVSK